jgi:hypothetical protein
MWLVWLVLALIAGVLFVWAGVFTTILVVAAASDELCPRCGLPLGNFENDREMDPYYIDRRYRSTAHDFCASCGWSRVDSKP